MTGRERWLLVAVLVACVGGAELYLARFHPQATHDGLLANEPAMYRASEHFSFELEPGFEGRHRREDFDVAIRINSLGFRGPEPAEDRDGATRILAIGDSFTFGWGVEEPDAWARRLEAGLRAAGRSGVEVLNAGYACGEYPDTYYLCLARRLDTLRPELVLVGFYVGNDIDGTAARARLWPEVDEAGLPLRVEHGRDHVEDGHWVRREKKLRYRIPVLRNSHLFHGIHDAGRAALHRRRPPEAGLDHPMLYEKPWSDETRAHADRVRSLFLALRDVCRERGVPLAVLMLPAVEQVHPEPWRALGFDMEKPQRAFKRFFRDAGIPALDLLPLLRAERDAEPLYFAHDTHWTAAGHALTAEAVEEFVLTELW